MNGLFYRGEQILLSPVPFTAVAALNKHALGHRSANDWLLLLNQARMASGFSKLLWFVHWHVCVCLCICVSASKPLITSDVIWCDIGHVRLVKQVLQLFTAFNYFIGTCCL